MRIELIFIFSLLGTLATPAASAAEVGEPFAADALQQSLIEQQEMKLQQMKAESERAKFSPWVKEEFQKIQDDQIDNELENFSFLMDRPSNYQFKWNPSKTGYLNLKVVVFVMKDNQLVFNTQPSEEEYLIVESRGSQGQRATKIGYVYCAKIIPVLIPDDYIIISFKKNFSKKLFVDVHLQSTGVEIEGGVSDDQFKISSQEIKGILKELEQTERKQRRLFLNEYSLQQRSQKHQSEMLVITGVELLAILGTCFVQMYSIKSLIDNRTVV